MENKVDITLYQSNGTSIVIKDVEKNGDSYIVDDEIEGIDGETFEKAVIGDTQIGCCEGTKVYSIDGRFWFAIMPISEEEIARRKLVAQVEYIAMMTDVELEV